MQDQNKNFPLQRINTSDKLTGSTNGMTRAQKTLSIHGMPSIAVPSTQPPSRSSIGGATGNSKWWCASFGAGSGGETDYLAQPQQQPDYLGPNRGKVCSFHLYRYLILTKEEQPSIE